MDSLYPNSQPFGVYENPQWPEDSKPVFVVDEHDSIPEDKTLDSMHSINSSSASESRRSSLMKVEDEFSASATPTATSASQMWQDRPHDNPPVRSFSTSHAPMLNGATHQFMRMSDPTFTGGLQHAHTWSIPHSGSSTPTPMYGSVYDMSYTHPPPGFSAYPHDPNSAVSMSPQSSQGGWASAASSDGTDQRGPDQRGIISPIYRPTSPGTVVRPDGIRKKNARFEIPKERNLANIDAMISASTDDNEKKELKQQKRLLRNRQAALDSRQRKKTHTEKLEAEKKISEKRMLDIEEALARTENTLAIEREQFLQERQHWENVIHALQYERDEAIRTKTIETAELRRQILVLKECVKDMENQQHRGYAPASHMDQYDDGYTNEFQLENDWDDDDGFNLINSDDLKMDDTDSLQRQATPKPSMPVSKPVDAKIDPGFSWATFYMCLLFGAFIASNNNSNNVDNNAASAIASSIPPTEASNVLKTVLSSGGVASEVLPTRPDTSAHHAVNRANHMNAAATLDANLGPSNLDHLHQSLSTPSRRQEMAAAFSMSASSYQHLTDPFGEQLNAGTNHDLHASSSPSQPTALQKAFASIQAHKDNIDKLTGMGSKARERSLLWDQVPPEVIKNFEAMVQNSANTNNNDNNNHNNNSNPSEGMEQ